MFTLINCRIILPAILLLIMMCGCSSPGIRVNTLETDNVPPGLKTQDNTYWWKCRFRIVWSDETDVDWGMDPLLAHALVSPILAEHSKDIAYWRFHRRAARDSAGHQFSFLFYSSPETAGAVFSEIQQSSLLLEAIQANHIQKVYLDDPGNPQLPNIEDTSDKNWSPELQKSWPLFIMGVSSLWLGLIDQYMTDSPDVYADFDSLLAKYREVDEKVTDTWRNEGQHALLHHLNAVFGYDPLYIRKMMTF